MSRNNAEYCRVYFTDLIKYKESNGGGEIKRMQNDMVQGYL